MCIYLGTLFRYAINVMSVSVTIYTQRALGTDQIILDRRRAIKLIKMNMYSAICSDYGSR